MSHVGAEIKRSAGGMRPIANDSASRFTRSVRQGPDGAAGRDTFGCGGKANVVQGVEILRHTFCSHLPMRGALARAIQEIAGHSELGMTQRHMHLSPAALDAAIRLLDGRGNMVATAANNS